MALKGEYVFGDIKNIEAGPYLVFGFEPNGILNQTITYSSSDVGIYSFVWNHKVIENVMDMDFDLSSFF